MCLLYTRSSTGKCLLYWKHFDQSIIWTMLCNTQPAIHPTMEPTRSHRAAPRQDRIRPISRVAQLPHRSEGDVHGIEAQREQQDRRPATPSRPRPPSLSQRPSSSPLPSPLYQTVIPAFHPNHYRLSYTTICLCIPLTIKTPLDRWRQRRRSAKELRARDDELREEYARLKQIESTFKGNLPPYEEAPKDGIHVRNEGFEQQRMAAVPNAALNQQRIVSST
jgi:hypothetical protein